MGAATLPAGWAVVPLGKAAQWLNGRAFKKSEWENHGRPIIRIQNLNDPEAEFNRTTHEFEDRYRVEDGDLLFAWAASLGAYEWKGESGWLNQHIFKVIPAAGVDNKFLFYFLKRVISDIYARTQGSGMVHITKSQFSSIPLLLPPQAEQRRIVAKIEELFSELDGSVANLKTARAQLRTYRQSLLKHAFEGRLTEQWRRDHADELESANQLLERIREERQVRYQHQFEDWKAEVAQWEVDGKPGKKPKRPRKPKEPESLKKDVFVGLPNIPDDWKWDRLGWMTQGVEYGTSQKSEPSGEVPVVRMGNLQRGVIDWGDLVYCSDSEEINRYELSIGDVLFNRTNSPELVGKAAIYRGERRALFAGYLIRINHMKDEIDSDYLNYFLMSYAARRYGDHVKTDAVNQSNINGEKLFHYPFPYCSLSEQRRIASLLRCRLSYVDSLEQSIERELARSDSLRQSILKLAFEGRLVPQSRDDEPARELLARLRGEGAEHVETVHGGGGTQAGAEA